VLPFCEVEFDLTREFFYGDNPQRSDFGIKQLWLADLETGAEFPERLLPLLVQVLVAGPLHHPPLFASKNLIPIAHELGRPMRVKG
jgi:hypothetical protein